MTKSKRSLHLTAPLTSPSLGPLLEELQRAYSFFNGRFFDGKLPPCLMAFFPQPPNGSRLGHYSPARWDSQALDDDGVVRGEPTAEIIFYADLCLRAGMEQVLQTLLHEMVHHWQYTFGAPGKNNHHNKEWHAKCAEAGLETEGPKGYTKSTPSFQATLRQFAPRDVLVPYRDQAGAKGAKGKMRKYTCACGYAIRVAKQDVSIRCNICGKDFKEA